MQQKTYAPYGDKNNAVQQAAGLYTMHMRRNSRIGQLTGSMPKGERGASATISRQTTEHMPIVRCEDLGKMKGDEVTFHLIQPFGAIPIMGSDYAEGRGSGLSITGDKLRVEQARIPVNLGDVMSRIRTPYDLRRLGRPIAQSVMNRYVDQSILVHMAGARGYHNDLTWSVPLDSSPEFAKVMVNRVKAPTKNRHYLADGAGIKPFTVNAGEVDIASTSQFNLGVVDAIRSTMEQVTFPMPGIIFEGDTAASDDDPLQVILVTAAQYTAFSTDPAFRQIQSNALARAAQAKNSPIFRGDIGLWHKYLIVKMPKPIRFYAGDTIKYCASYTSEIESTCVVPASFSTTYAIDRAIVLGGQALAEALASTGEEKSGLPFFWSEKKLDHDDKLELLIGVIRGVSKIRFEVDMGDAGKQFTDNGVTVVDTVVKTIGPRM